MSRHLLVVGGGIGGLASALALRRAGDEVTVFEKAPAFGEVGAGVTMTPPGLRAMDALGLGGRILDLSDNVARTAFHEWDTGALIRVSDPPPPVSILDETRVCHRTDLHQLLLDGALAAGVEMHTGHAVVHIDQDDTGVAARFSNGRTVRGDALIGCDGLKSTVRSVMFGEVAPRRTGYIAFRALLQRAIVEDLIGPHGSAVHVGHKANFVRYTVRHGEVLNCVGLALSEAGGEENWSTPSTRAEFKAHFPGWNAYIYALIDRIPEDQLYKWPLFDREPLGDWTRGKVTLVGDAAHPMLPFLGIGATMALEDAVVLAGCLRRAPTVEAAFGDYVGLRQPRAAEVTYASRAQGERIMGPQSTDMFRGEMRRNPVFDHDVRG